MLKPYDSRRATDKKRISVKWQTAYKQDILRYTRYCNLYSESIICNILSITHILILIY
jgi:hypothetical protein